MQFQQLIHDVLANHPNLRSLRLLACRLIWSSPGRRGTDLGQWCSCWCRTSHGSDCAARDLSSTRSKRHAYCVNFRVCQENPFEALKTQKQVRGLDYKQALRAGCLWQGLSATCCRNVVLVTLFFVLTDKLNRSSELVNFRQHPFLRGCVVTSCCWVAAWPLDVVKSQLQSVQAIRQTSAVFGTGSACVV
ncbi:unnamed protein product [Symbiodinium pilosum]|uniref:Uncharacterized protein n=1 Tax=Symbiodinium pilosum TaxID=2952 RepID=A0A812TH84_SYMPI|nr:unnamed protein product [Symbiodinium pilosum]